MILLLAKNEQSNTGTTAANGRILTTKRMCSYRLQLSKTRRTQSPYAIAKRSASSRRRAAYLQPAAKTHPPPCKGIKTEQNQIKSRQRITQPSVGVCVNRNQSQIRIEFDPATPASTMSIVITVSSASHVQFVIPIGIPKMSGAGSSVCTTTRSRRCRCRCRTYNHNKIPVSE